MSRDNEIAKGVEIVSLALYFRKIGLLAIGDMHLGQEEGFNRQGVLLPRTNYRAVMAELKNIFARTGKVKTVVLLGDVKHEFGPPNDQEWGEVIDLFNFLKEKSERAVVLRGNHDNYLSRITEHKKVTLVESLLEGGYFFCHGDKTVEAPPEARIIVMGHEHAAIVLSDDSKREKFKCFAKTKIKVNVLGKDRKSGSRAATLEKDVIIMPSFNFLSIGTNLQLEGLLSPYLRGMASFECWVVEDGKSFYFGRIKRRA